MPEFAVVAFQLEVPLHRSVWWRIGDPAAVFAEVKTIQAPSRLRAAGTAARVPVLLLGNGPNLQVSDAGIRGLMIKVAGELAEMKTLAGRSALRFTWRRWTSPCTRPKTSSAASGDDLPG